MKELTWKAVLAVILAAALQVFGGWDVALQSLLVLIVLDIASGCLRAFVQQSLSSKESWRGTAKKLMIFVAIAVATQADKFAGTGSTLCDATSIFYCASEALSVLENLVAAGLPVPEFLRKALAQLNPDKVDESDAEALGITVATKTKGSKL